MTIQTNDIEAAKAAARAELDAHRARVRANQAAQEAAALTAEAEIEREIRARRDAEAKRAELAAARAVMLADREARIEAEREADRRRKLDADPRLRIADTPERRLAKILYRRLGDDFAGFATDLGLISFNRFRYEIRNVAANEQAEALHRKQQETRAKLAAEAATLPTPESPAEAAILRKHGFISEVRAAELDAGAL